MSREAGLAVTHKCLQPNSQQISKNHKQKIPSQKEENLNHLMSSSKRRFYIRKAISRNKLPDWNPILWLMKIWKQLSRLRRKEINKKVSKVTRWWASWSSFRIENCVRLLNQPQKSNRRENSRNTITIRKDGSFKYFTGIMGHLGQSQSRGRNSNAGTLSWQKSYKCFKVWHSSRRSSR